MKKVLKILSLAVTLLLAAVAIFVYVSFNGDPLSSYLARQKMVHYLSQTYPVKTFAVQAVHYDFKIGRYEAEVVEGADHSFRLAGTPSGVQYDEYKYTYAMDEALTNRFSDQLAAELEALLKPAFPPLNDVGSDFYVAKGAYPADTVYTQGMESNANLEISLVGEEFPAADFASLCAAIRDSIVQAGYRPLSIRCLYNEPEVMAGKTGMLLYTLKIGQSAFSASPAALLPSVQEYNLKQRK